MKGPMKVYYDEEGDFLEISVGKPTKCYASEVKPGVFLRIDDKFRAEILYDGSLYMEEYRIIS